VKAVVDEIGVEILENMGFQKCFYLIKEIAGYKI
jgi:hypothetical protein